LPFYFRFGSEIFMTRYFRFINAFFLIALVFTTFARVAAAADDGIPAWLKQAAATSAPAYPKDVRAVVLHKEQQVTLGGDGKLVTIENYAVRILTREGRQAAVAIAPYYVSFGKVRDMNGWTIRPDGTVKEMGKKSIIDVIADPDDVYNEGRAKIITLPAKSTPVRFSATR
jgi:ribosomal protein L14